MHEGSPIFRRQPVFVSYFRILRFPEIVDIAVGILPGAGIQRLKSRCATCPYIEVLLFVKMVFRFLCLDFRLFVQGQSITILK